MALRKKSNHSLFYLLSSIVIVLLLITLSDLRFTGAAITIGYDNSEKVTVNDTVPIVNQKLIITQLTKDCRESIYIDTEGLPIEFWIENPTYNSEDYCTGANIMFNNIIYNMKGSGEETITYSIYYNLDSNCGDGIHNTDENMLNCPIDCIRNIKLLGYSFGTIALLAVLFLIIGWGIISHRRQEKKYPKLKAPRKARKKKRVLKKIKSPKAPKPSKKHKAKL